MACCIKGCNSRRGKNASCKKSFFTAYTNDMFISWSNVFCNKNIKLTKKSTICELHFKAEDIIREDTFLQDDGAVIYVKRGKPKLKEGAVPSIFPPEKIPYYQQIERKNIDVVSSEVSTCGISETSHSMEEKEISKFSAQHLSSGKSTNLKNIDVMSSEVSTCGISETSHSMEEKEISKFSAQHLSSGKSTNLKNIDVMSSEVSTCEISETSHLMEEKEISKFSAQHLSSGKSTNLCTEYWFANINDRSMMWTCWANDLAHILRRVILTPNMKLQVFIGNKKISFHSKRINNIQEMGQILMELQNFFPCENVNDKDRVTNCNGFVVNRQCKKKQKRKCLPCKKNWKMLLRKENNLTPLQKLKNKERKLQTSNLNYKRREKRLRSKQNYIFER